MAFCLDGVCEILPGMEAEDVMGTGGSLSNVRLMQLLPQFHVPLLPWHRHVPPPPPPPSVTNTKFSHVATGCSVVSFVFSILHVVDSLVMTEFNIYGTLVMILL